MKRIILGILLVIVSSGCAPTIRQLSQKEITGFCASAQMDAESASSEFLDSVNNIGTSRNDGGTSHRGDKLHEARNRERFWCSKKNQEVWVKDYEDHIEITEKPSKK